MIDITLQNFESEMIKGSASQPVLLDSWAPWCGPCKARGPLLEKLETAYAGRFRLAKLNSDDQPEIAGQLSQMFGVRSSPFCVLCKDGQPGDGFGGARPESQVREFLDRHLESAPEPEPAPQLNTDADPEAALGLLRTAVTAHPDDDEARHKLLRALVAAGSVDEARRAYEPLKGRVMLDVRLSAVGQWLAACDAAAGARSAEALATAIDANKRDFAARLELAQTHFAAQRWTAAMDELLEIVIRDKAWNDETARKAYVAVLELMTKPAAAAMASQPAPKGALEIAGRDTTPKSDPVVDAYRRKLSMALN